MVAKGPQHASEIRHAGAAAAELLRHSRGEDLARLERGIVLGDEGIRLVVCGHTSREAGSKLVRKICPAIDRKWVHSSLLVGGAAAETTKLGRAFAE